MTLRTTDLARNAGRRGWIVTVLVTAAVAVVIAIGTLMPVSGVPGLSRHDKLYHMAGFAALVFPVALVRPRLLPVMAVLAIAYGGAIEIVQPGVGRARDVMDWAADAGGVVAGGMAGLLARTLWRRCG